MSDKVPIRRLPTGVPGLDAVLGGGVPEFSFNVIAGTPGAGKTTLVQQIMFALARADRPALFFTVLGEPPLKMLRYQQQFEFFDLAKVNASVRFINLAKEAREGGLDAVLKRIVQEVEATSPAIVIVDSFRSVMQAATADRGARRAALRPGTGHAVDRLAGDDLSCRRVSAGRDREPSHLHGRGRSRLAVPEPRSQFDGEEDAGHEDARSGAHSRPAHLSHHRPRACRCSRD
jgi:hypothetical protein